MQLTQAGALETKEQSPLLWGLAFEFRADGGVVELKLPGVGQLPLK